ncbi:MAG: hypothetical protein ABSF83_11200 [Nitrososphaerales archaeon]|jgi:hypothetical protein
MTEGGVLGWLLQEDQPSVRYLALTRLLDRPEDDPDVSSARRAIPTRGWAADILSREHEGGWWERSDRLYQPKYLSTNWMLLVLSDLGVTRSDPRVEEACERWIRAFAKEDGGFGPDGSKRSHLCTAGNTARGLVKLGYADHPSVRSAFEWMAKNASEKGGWSCFGGGRNLDSWEPLSAFAVYPRERWTGGMKRAVEKGAEFFLERELHVQGEHYEPWYRFHYPVHYYYDLLVGLDLMVALGYGGDGRLAHAAEALRKRRRADGRWNLDAVHPDMEGGMAEFYRTHPKQAPAPFALERAGEPSRMITLRALGVLKGLEDAGAG